MMSLRIKSLKLLSRATGFTKARWLSTHSTSQRPSYYHYIGRDPLVYRNIGQQLDLTVEKFGDREAIVSCHENERYTFAAIREKSDKLAAAFIKLGLQKGDAIGIWAPNNIHWYVTMMAAARYGLTSVGINPVFQGPEVEYCINKVGVKAIVAPEAFRSQRYYEILESVIPELGKCQPGKLQSSRTPTLRSVIIDSKDNLPGAFTYKELFDLPGADEMNAIRKNSSLVQPDSPCNIQFTSGTTGKPKATVLSHYGLLNNGIHIGNRNEFTTGPHRICTQVPLFHAFGVVISIMAGLTHGVTLVLPDSGFNPEASLNAIMKENCTIIHGTPTMYVDLIAKQRELKLPIKTAQIAITGGAPCSPSLFQSVLKELGLKQMKTVFGLTETTAVIFQSMIGEGEDRLLETVGHIQDHIEAKVIDAEGNVVPFGQPGELCIRGYLNMLEYYDDEAKTKEIFGNDRWLKTGDQFILEESGYGRIVGRLKEMIIRGGENIFPKEVEDFLNTHPDIMETHVIGVPDERLGEEVCAFIRLKNGVKSLTQPQIKEYCKGKVAHFKVPKFVVVVEDIPKTTSGKIQKFKLKEIFDKVKKV